MGPLISCSCDDFVPISSIKEQVSWKEKVKKKSVGYWGDLESNRRVWGEAFPGLTENSWKSLLYWGRGRGSRRGRESRKGKRKQKGKGKGKWKGKNRKSSLLTKTVFYTNFCRVALWNQWDWLIKKTAIYFTGPQARSWQFKKPKVKGKQAFG